MIKAISNSMLDLWLKCGEAFKFRYLEELKIPPGIAAHRGSAIHKATEINHKQKIDTEEDMPLDSLQDAARDEYVMRCKEGVLIPPEDRPQKDKLLNEGLNDAISMTKSYKDEIAPQIMPAIVEKYMSEDFGFEYPICGIIDVIDIVNIKHDIKTCAKIKSAGWETKELQPTFYTLLRPPLNNIASKFKYHIITPQKVQELETQRTATDINHLIKYIKVFMRDLKVGIFKPAELGHWFCSEKWCGYYPICKYKQ